MGLQLPSRAATPLHRGARAAALGLSMLALAACSAEDKEQIGRLAMPAPASEQAYSTFELWKWTWVAAGIVGVIVWGLMFYSAWRFRRTKDNQVPVQVRYNLPIEIFYTIAPIMMVIVFFYWTVNVQNTMTEIKDDPDVTVDVVAQQWSWTFNHTPTDEGTEHNGDPVPYVFGTVNNRPTLVLPVDKTIHFNLHSPDVIHSFSIDRFLTKLDVIPGRVNELQVKTTEVGDFRGKCFELCGVYHSKMIFDVRVVSEAEYEDYLAELVADGNVAKAPVLGGSDVNTQPGLKIQDEGADQ